MALCLAESLTACGGFDAADQMRHYVRWYREGCAVFERYSPMENEAEIARRTSVLRQGTLLIPFRSACEIRSVAQGLSRQTTAGQGKGRQED
jgi:hypothetical protein